MFGLIRLFATLLLVALAAGAAAAQAADRLDAIRARGRLVCGVWPEVRGFATVNTAGQYEGFDVDICRAVATAILGNPDRIQFVKTATVQEFLANQDVDLVSRRLTWSLTREGTLGLRFGPVTFYDGQGFLVPKRYGITRVEQLSGRPVCVETGTPSEFNLGPLFRDRKLALEQVVLDAGADVAAEFSRGRCQAYTADVTMLGSIRAGFAEPARFEILQEMVSKEPLAQVVRQQDAMLFDILRWTVFALINAEEMGITAANVDAMKASSDPDVQRLLGVAPGNGAPLRLPEHWAYDVIKALGNYGEIYDRNVGGRSTVHLARGPNRLWTAGGLMWAPPAR